MSIKHFEAEFIVRNSHLMGDFEKAVMGIDEDLFEAEPSTNVGALWKAVLGSTGDDFASKAETQDAENRHENSESERKTDDISGDENQQAEESTTETAIQFVGTRSQLVVVLLRAAIVTVLDSRTDPTDEDKFEAKVLIRFLNRFLQNELIEEDFFGVVDAVGAADVNRKVNTMFGFKFAGRNVFDDEDDVG
jgi:hypothetical protein